MSLIPIPASAEPDVKESFRKLNAVLERLTGGNNVDWHGRRIINAGDAVQGQDYVTLDQAKKLVSDGVGTAEPAAPPSVGGSNSGGGGGSGDFSGPGSSTDSDFVQFNGTSGKTGKDGGYSPSSFDAAGAATAAEAAAEAYADGVAAAAVVTAEAYTDAEIASHAADSDAHKGEKNSIELDAGDLQFVNDEASPGNNKVYGTDGSGVRGWKDDPAGGSGDVSGPGLSTDNGIPRWSGTGGDTLDDTTGPLLEDDGRISTLTDPTNVQDAATKNYVDEQIANLNAGGAAQNTFLVSGGQVVWVTGFQFLVSAATYYINGVLYSSPETSVTLDAADASDDRLDFIIVDDSETIGKVTGDPSTPAVTPVLDPSTQLGLALVPVPASSTEPVGATTVSVYAEDAGSPGEWDWTSSGTGWTLNSTNNPRGGTTDIEATTISSGAYIQAAIGSGSLDPNDYDQLVFYIRSKANWTKNRTLQLRLQNAGGVAVGQTITIGDGQYGFDSTNTASYQQIAVPVTAFAVPAGTTVTQIRLTRAGSSTIGFYLDDMAWVKTGGTQTQTGITQAQADARYAPLGPSFVTLGTDATLPNERVLTGSGRVSVTDAGAGSTVTLDVPDDGVTNAKLANMAEATFKLRAAGAGSGDPVDGTADQAATILDTATDPPVRSSVGAMVDDGNSGTSKTIDWDSKAWARHTLTLTGNVTLTLNNPVDGGCYVLLIKSGAGSFTVTWPGSVLWPSGVAPVITATASKVDLVTLIWDATASKYYGSFNQNY